MAAPGHRSRRRHRAVRKGTPQWCGAPGLLEVGTARAAGGAPERAGWYTRSGCSWLPPGKGARSRVHDGDDDKHEDEPEGERDHWKRVTHGLTADRRESPIRSGSQPPLNTRIAQPAYHEPIEMPPRHTPALLSRQRTQARHRDGITSTSGQSGVLDVRDGTRARPDRALATPAAGHGRASKRLGEARTRPKSLRPPP
jgi:hypothetical protein